MLYDVVYFSENWLTRRAFDRDIYLPDLDAHHRAIATNTNGNGHKKYWDGSVWVDSAPAKLLASPWGSLCV
jgi:hypothetical protein